MDELRVVRLDQGLKAERDVGRHPGQAAERLDQVGAVEVTINQDATVRYSCHVTHLRFTRSARILAEWRETQKVWSGRELGDGGIGPRRYWKGPRYPSGTGASAGQQAFGL